MAEPGKFLSVSSHHRFDVSLEEHSNVLNSTFSGIQISVDREEKRLQQVHSNLVGTPFLCFAQTVLTEVFRE